MSQDKELLKLIKFRIEFFMNHCLKKCNFLSRGECILFCAKLEFENSSDWVRCSNCIKFFGEII
jgi:hypothetical protein